MRTPRDTAAPPFSATVISRPQPASEGAQKRSLTITQPANRLATSSIQHDRDSAPHIAAYQPSHGRSRRQSGHGIRDFIDVFVLPVEPSQPDGWLFHGGWLPGPTPANLRREYLDAHSLLILLNLELAALDLPTMIELEMLEVVPDRYDDTCNWSISGGDASPTEDAVIRAMQLRFNVARARV